MSNPAPNWARTWALHLLCLVLPLTTLVFTATGPHPWPLALGFVLVLVASVMIDNRAGPARAQPLAELPRAPFDALLVLLVLLQLLNIALTGRLIALAGLWSVDALVALVLVGTNSGYSAIVVAHELIHRPGKTWQLLGRMLLCTVLYEHFYTEHLRGHHVRVGTVDDPATARFGESFNAFWKRTLPGQFKSAWRLEQKRVGDRWWKNRVLHGIVAELAISAAITLAFGWAALVVFALQALGAVRLLEAVNYFEHWGLQRSARKVQTVDSWDAESWFTLYTLVGLSRHADHHAHATRAFHDLRWFDDSPKLPRGYFGMVVMVLFRNRRFRRLMTAELERKKLGPFAEA